jgi:hypothetical protein
MNGSHACKPIHNVEEQEWLVTKMQYAAFVGVRA